MSGRYKLYAGGFVLSMVALVGIGLAGLLDALSVVTGGVYYGETFLLLAMVQEAAEWLVAGVVVGLLALLFLAATVVSVLRSKSLPKSSRIAGLVERLEHEYPVLRRFDAAERFEPTTEDRADRLKQRYVEGEISEQEFEREMDRILDDESGQHRSHRPRNVDFED